MLERILNAVLESEMDARLSIESRESGNRCNARVPFWPIALNSK